MPFSELMVFILLSPETFHAAPENKLSSVPPLLSDRELLLSVSITAPLRTESSDLRFRTIADTVSEPLLSVRIFPLTTTLPSAASLITMDLFPSKAESPSR